MTLPDTPGFYTVYGLTLSLPFPCPVLPPAAPGSNPDVFVTDGLVPPQLPDPQAGEANWQAAPGRFLLRGGRRAGRFLVEGGSRVTLQRSPQAEDEMLAFHFLDSVLSAVLRQRGLLVLHANCAVRPAGAVAVSGLSGSGKSTALAALLDRGWRMLADDITALRLDGSGQVLALPGVPQFHLTEDSAARLERDISGLPRFAWRRMKAAIPSDDRMAPGPAPLQALYILSTYAGDALELRPLGGVEKFQALQECCYGPLLPGDHPDLFPLFLRMTESVAVIQVRRPEGRWTVDELVERILHG